MGRQIRNSVSSFHTQLKPQWPDVDNLHARESVSKLKQETVFNTRHKAKPLPSIRPGTEVFVKELQRLGKVIEAASTPRSHKGETTTSTITRNRVHLTPLPNQQEQQERPTPIVNQVPTEDKFKAATPVRKDIPVKKGLFSYHVTDFFREKWYENEYQYVKVIAQWHESSDRRGISQLKSVVVAYMKYCSS